MKIYDDLKESILNPVSWSKKIAWLAYKKQFAEKTLKCFGIKSAVPLTSGDASIVNEIYYNRVYADVFPFYSKNVIVDIGAHKGFFALFAAKHSSPDSTIHCFEPASENRKALLANLAVNSVSTVNVYPQGIGPETARDAKLYISRDYNNTTEISQSGLQANTVENIEIVSLEDALDKTGVSTIDFLKCDCEGAEYEAFYRAPTHVWKRITRIAVEFHDLKHAEKSGDALASFLSKNGYEIRRMRYNQTMLPVQFGVISAIASRNSI